MHLHGRPINRIRLQQTIIVVMLFFALISEPVLTAAPAATVISVIGIICIVVSTAGRTWSTFHTGTRKNLILVKSGPYGICRNPLYLFSLFGAAGFGLMHGSLLFTLVIMVAWGAIILKIIFEEESILLAIFGLDYQHYLNSVPRILPLKLSNWANIDLRRQGETQNRVRHYLDSLLIPLLIPAAEIINYIRDLGGLALWRIL